MTRTILILTLSFTVLACGNNQVNHTSFNSTEIRNSMDTSSCSQAMENKEFEIKDSIDWTYLDYLNQDLDYAFAVEDSINGIGVVVASNPNQLYDQVFKVFDDHGDVTLSVSRTHGTVVYKDETYSYSDSLRPILPRVCITNPDYFNLAFDCVRADKELYTVVLNRSTGERGYIRVKDMNFKLVSFVEFIDNHSAFNIDFDRSTNPLRKFANVESEVITNDKQLKYKIWSGERLSIEGDWMKVNIRGTQELGWIRWRERNKILIKVHYAC